MKENSRHLPTFASLSLAWCSRLRPFSVEGLLKDTQRVQLDRGLAPRHVVIVPTHQQRHLIKPLYI
jgi:hypothetical protein